MSVKETSLSYTSIMTENNDNHQPPNYGATNSANNNDNEYAATSSSPSAQVVLLPPSPKPAAHLSTYTAGEDAGRLATMAKEFGLSRVRPPRNQIREKVPDELSKLNLSSLKYWYERMVQLDTSFLEMRIKSVYIRDHDDDDDDEYDGDDETTSKGDGYLLHHVEEKKGLLASGNNNKRGNKLSSWDEEEDMEQDNNATFSLEQAKSQVDDDAMDPDAAGLGGTLPSAVLGIIKGMVGPAILYLPHGFASAGYMVAVPVLMLSTILFLWSSACLLESWRIESERIYNQRKNMGNISLKINRITLSYPELAYRSFGRTGETLVQLGISLMQSGVCLTYLIFVPQNLRSSALVLFDTDISTNWWLAFMMGVQIPMSWIRDIRRLTVTNLLANVLILYGLITCLGFALDAMGSSSDTITTTGSDDGYDGANSHHIIAGDENNENTDIRDDHAGEDDRPFLTEAIHRFRSLPPFNPSGWFLFLGTSVLLFEGSITLLVPLQEAVHRPSDRRKFPSLYRRVILGIVLFYSFFGISCWMAFGNEVKTVMTTSLPPGNLATSVQLAYSLAVVFTFPLQNFPSLEIICRAVEKKLAKIGWSYDVGSGGLSSGSSSKTTTKNPFSQQRNIISTMIVIGLSIIAVTCMNDLDKVVSLMGSMLGCPLAFVVPPLIHNRLGKGQIGKWRRVGNGAVAGLGVVAMVISSIATVLKWD